MQERNPNIIPIDKCKDRYLYIIDARNASIGIYHQETKTFIISRHKFKSNFLFNEVHYDADEDFGTATPLIELEEVSYISEEEELKYLNRRAEELSDQIKEIERNCDCSND